MNERARTILLLVVALALAALAWLTRPATIGDPGAADVGVPLTPALTDPAQVASLEIIAYDDADARHRAIKVEFDGERWVIPSAFGYPADAVSKIAQASSMFVGLTKQAVVSEQRIDHASLGLVDPTDESGDPSGRGVRVTIGDREGRTLADVIIGRTPDDGAVARGEERFVRLADADRAYRTTFPSALAPALSVNLVDWIDPDLLRVSAPEINRVEIDASTVDEAEGRRIEGERIALRRSADGESWSLAPSGEFADADAVGRLLTTLDGLELVGVEPMPGKISRLITGEQTDAALDASDVARLQRAGLFLTRDARLIANAGQLTFSTDEGLVTTIWFGEVAETLIDRSPIFRDGDTDEGGPEPVETRLVFVTVQAADPGDPEAVAKAQERSRRLARWWFLIRESDSAALHPDRGAFAPE